MIRKIERETGRTGPGKQSVMRMAVAMLLATLVVSGCVARVSTSTVDKLSPAAFTDASTGVVVLSVGASETRADNQTMLLVFDRASNRLVPDLSIWIDSREEPSDFPEYHGNVHAVRLPPGSYSLTPGTLNFTTRTRPTFPLEVRAGETTYVGELYMAWNGEREALFTVRDRYDRDLAVARAKNPAIEARPVVKRLLPAGEPLRR